MNQCVPRWNVDETHLSPRQNIAHQSISKSLTIDISTLNYDITELTWENGQPAMLGLGIHRVPEKPTVNEYMWGKSSAGGGTLESLVDQATACSHRNPNLDGCGGGNGGNRGGNEVIPWDVVHSSATTTTGALVPCNTTNSTTQNTQVSLPHALSTRVAVGGCSTRVESCSGVPDTNTNTNMMTTRTGTGTDTGIDHSVSNNPTWGRDSYQQVTTFDTCERELGTAGGFTSPSMGSPENASPTPKKWNKNTDEHDSDYHGKTQVETADEEEKNKGKCPMTLKRGRAAAVHHNMSERKRRDRINQRMKTLQKMIPNSNKTTMLQTDKASMLDEVIEYLKQLQAQVQMMKGISMSNMMFPLAMQQQQLQMSLMSPMGMAGMGMPGMGMAGMGMPGMDMNTLSGRANMSGMPPFLYPGAYMHMPSWDSTGDPLTTSVPAMPDPLSAFFACQSQPMTVDAYSRMASLYQQLQQPPDPSLKN